MKTLVGVMGFSILFCALLTLHDPGRRCAGLFVPDHSARQRQLRAVDHRRHRRLDHDAVLQLLDARGAHQRGRRSCGYVRGDVAIAYLFTAIFGMSVMLIANQAFYRRPASRSPTRRRCRRWRRCWARCSAVRRLRVFAGLLGGGVCLAPRRVAERAVSVRRLLRHPEARCRTTRASEVTKVTSLPYRLALHLHHAGADAVRLHAAGRW